MMHAWYSSISRCGHTLFNSRGPWSYTIYIKFCLKSYMYMVFVRAACMLHVALIFQFSLKLLIH